MYQPDSERQRKRQEKYDPILSPKVEEREHLPEEILQHGKYELLGAGLGVILDKAVLVDLDLDVAADLEHDGGSVLLHFVDDSVDTARGNDLVTLLEFLAEILQFLLLLALRTDHEEIHNSEDEKEHDPHAGGSTALGSCGLGLKNDCKIVHNLLIFFCFYKK
jgi:hypothetical protein